MPADPPTVTDLTVACTGVTPFFVCALFAFVMATRTYGRPPESVQAVAGDEQATVWWEVPAV